MVKLKDVIETEYGEIQIWSQNDMPYYFQDNIEEHEVDSIKKPNT